MALENQDVALYLKRIDCHNDIYLGLDGLYELQKSHVLNIPFENLDIHNDVPIVLNVGLFFNKIVGKNRGGFCYELNGLFCELLNSVGYKTTMVSGRVFDELKGYGSEYDHMTLIVEIDGEEFLCDVGFGEFAIGPLKIVEEIEQKDERGAFKIDRYDEKYFQVTKKVKSKWVPQYIFSKVQSKLVDFEGMCNFHQTSSDSHFTLKKMISKGTESGRITLTGNTLTIKKEGIVYKSDVKDEDHFQLLYKTYFR